MSTLNAEGVVSGYGEVEILHGVSVRVDEGEVVAIIGPNGAGKSTLIKALFGLLPVFRGTVKLGDADITGMRPDRLVGRGMAYVPQVDNVFPSLTVHENLAMGAWLGKKGFNERADDVYGLFPDLIITRRASATLVDFADLGKRGGTTAVPGGVDPTPADGSSSKSTDGRSMSARPMASNLPFTRALHETSSYSIEDDILTLHDDDDERRVTFAAS